MSRALGRYELLRPLARGGMGEVYLARRRAAGVEKWLVVKRMRPERSGDTRFLDLFMREAKLSMSLTHQNIVPVFDFGRIDDQVFLAMERVEGKDLGSSLQKAGAGVPPLLAAFIAAECLQALDYAHRRKGPDGVALGIVHRDVTPRNVLLSWSGEVKLTDFGIAALAGDSPSRAAGTPAYMAPEQARGEESDVRADLYGVGLVLREALTGQRARSGNDRETVLDQAKHGGLDPWPAATAVDPQLKAIVDRATQTDRTARYDDARAMIEDLDVFMVAERAAKKGDTPSRQLGAWLTDVWKDTREDEGALDAQIEAGVLVSFVDDGPLDVIGTGTQRSALATAADEAASRPSEKIEVAPELVRGGEADAARAGAVKTGVKPSGVEPSADKVVEGPARRRVPLVPIVGLGIAVAGLVAWQLSRRGDEPRRDAPVVATAPQDGPTLAVASADGSMVVETDATADAGTTVSTMDAGLADAGSERPRPRPRDGGHEAVHTGGAGSAGSGSSVADEPPSAAKRRVTINSKPWSNWSVDGGAQHSGLETIELAPGPHAIHFSGNPYFKADKTVTITVPDQDGFTHVETLEAPAAPGAPPHP